jgi:predicted esterase
MNKILLALSLFLFPAIYVIAQNKLVVTNVNANVPGYLEHLPDDYNTTNTTHALIVFLHGIGELGDGSNLINVAKNGIPYLIQQNKFPASFTVAGKTFSFIVLSPQFRHWPGSADVNSFIDYALKHYRINTQRIYVTGLSMGGGATWVYGSYYGNRVAAVVPMCGATVLNSTQMQAFAKNNVPVWAFHNKTDTRVSPNYTYNNIKNLNALQPAIVPKQTIFDDAGHDCWTQASDPSYKENNLNIYEWMLLHTRDGNSTTDTVSIPETGEVVFDTSKGFDSTVIANPTDSIRKAKVYLPVQSNGQVYLKDRYIDAEPGDTLIIPTAIPLQSIYLWGIHGTSDKHITIRFDKKNIAFGGYTGYNFVMNDCRFIDFPEKVTIDGKGTSGNGMIIGTKCHDIFFKDASISNTAAGLQVKWEPVEGDDSTYYPIASIKNIAFGKVYIHNTRGEGVYEGHSGTMSTTEIAAGKLPPQVYGFRIDTLIVDGTDWDGAQFSNTQGLELGYVSISNYGRANKQTQRDGFLSGGSVTLAKPINYLSVSNGTGSGIRILSRGLYSINNATLTKTGLTPGEHAVYVDDRPTPFGLPALQLQFNNFTIDSTAGNAMFITNYRKTQIPGNISNVNYIRAKPIIDNAHDVLTNIKQTNVAVDTTQKTFTIIRTIKYKKKYINVILDNDGNLSASYAQ